MVMLLASPAIAGADEPVLNMDWLASGDPSTPISFNPADVGDHVPGDDGSTIFTGSLLGDTWDLAWTTRARSDECGLWPPQNTGGPAVAPHHNRGRS